MESGADFEGNVFGLGDATSSQTYMNQPHSPLAKQAQGHRGIQSAAVPGDM
jgi:hypothetical protein